MNSCTYSKNKKHERDCHLPFALSTCHVYCHEKIRSRTEPTIPIQEQDLSANTNPKVFHSPATNPKYMYTLAYTRQYQSFCGLLYAYCKKNKINKHTIN